MLKFNADTGGSGRPWTLAGELLLNLGESRDLVADGANLTAVAATVDVAADGALTARFTARLPSGAGAGGGSIGVPVGRGMHVVDGTLTMNATFAAAAVTVGEDGEARAQATPAPAELTGFIHGQAAFDRFDHMAGLGGGSCPPRHIPRPDPRFLT